jgi:ketosteroid isomerase-like protein
VGASDYVRDEMNRMVSAMLARQGQPEDNSICGGATVCFHKIDAKWMVTHEHNSVPFDVESGKASLDFKP